MEKSLDFYVKIQNKTVILYSFFCKDLINFRFVGKSILKKQIIHSMKKIILSVALVIGLGISQAYAQGIEYGVKGGLTLPNLTSGGVSTPLSDNYASITAWGAGVFADFKLTQTFSIQTGLELSRQGGRKDGVQALPATPIYASVMATNPQFALLKDFLPEDYLYADFKSIAHFDYLMLPVQAKFGWNLSHKSPFRVYVSAGVFASYLLEANRLSKGTFPPFYVDALKGSLSKWALDNKAVGMMPEEIQQMILGGIDLFANAQAQVDNKENITSDIRRGNFGFIGVAGLSYQLSKRNKIFIEAGGNYGLVKLQKDPINGQNRIGAATVMAGYAILIGQ
jgi:hypothetical protein